MHILNKKEATLLFLGDIIFLTLSLWGMLFIRYWQWPPTEAFFNHLLPFSFLFVIWLVVYFIAGLYEKHTVILRKKLPIIIFNTQLINACIAIIFFYFIPYFGITPKVNLFIYLILSFILILFWRIYGYGILGFSKRQKALLIGSGKEMAELYSEVNNNSRYSFYFSSVVDIEKNDNLDLKKEILEKIDKEDISIVIVDLHNKKVDPILPHLYDLIFSKVSFVDMMDIYEDIFDRIPFSLLQYSWFLQNISNNPKPLYDFLKRSVELCASFLLMILSFVFYPFVFLAIKLEDRKNIFIKQIRVGQAHKPVAIYKFRSMQENENGVWIGETENKVTKVGNFIRKFRIDELPQLWNVIKGDISLIGPRPDLVGLEERLRVAIPYYSTRYLVKPGLSGWAQIKQDYSGGKISPQSIEDNRLRLAYDLYYIKNRSIILDIKIALQTIKTLLSKAGK